MVLRNSTSPMKRSHNRGESTCVAKMGTGNVMVSQCANPNCRRELCYLRDGKIYRFVLSAKTGSKRLEHFCLCRACSKHMSLTCVNPTEVNTERPLQVCPNQPCSQASRSYRLLPQPR